MGIDNQGLVENLDRVTYASKSAGTFRIYTTRWVLNHSKPKGLVIPSFDEWPPEQKEAFLRLLAELATKHSANTISGYISALKNFARHFAESDDFSECGVDVENLLRYLIIEKQKEFVGCLRRLIIGAHDLGYGAAFEGGVLTVAEQYKGSRVRLHPDRFEHSRSFTESERKQLFYQLARQSHLGKLPERTRIISTLCLITGKRPVQIAHSKFMDFSVEDISLGQGDYRRGVLFNAPVAKQKGQTFRSKFNQCPISLSSFDVWADLEWLRRHYVERIESLTGIALSEEQSLMLPLVINSVDELLLERFGGVFNGEFTLNELLRSDRLHTAPINVGYLIRVLNEHLTIFSDYTNQPLTINAKRFRHTLATSMALSGCSAEEIAYALDHASRQSAIEYINNLPARAVKIGAQTENLGFLAKKFSGIEVPESGEIINLYTKNGPKDVGRCGLDAVCNENYPIACYSCELFRPNPLGNHASVQKYVEQKAQEAKEYGDSRQVENWNTTLIAVLERRYLADQERLQMLEEAPQVLSLEQKEISDE